MIIETDDVYIDISSDIEKWFGMPNYDERRRKRPLPGGMKKVIGLMKYEKDGKIIFKNFVATIPKCYSYWAQKDDHDIEDSWVYTSKRSKLVGK